MRHRKTKRLFFVTPFFLRLFFCFQLWKPLLLLLDLHFLIVRSVVQWLSSFPPQVAWFSFSHFFFSIFFGSEVMSDDGEDEIYDEENSSSDESDLFQIEQGSLRESFLQLRSSPPLPSPHSIHSSPARASPVCADPPLDSADSHSPVLEPSSPRSLSSPKSPSSPRTPSSPRSLYSSPSSPSRKKRKNPRSLQKKRSLSPLKINRNVSKSDQSPPKTARDPITRGDIEVEDDILAKRTRESGVFGVATLGKSWNGELTDKFEVEPSTLPLSQKDHWTGGSFDIARPQTKKPKRVIIFISVREIIVFFCFC